MCPLTNEWIKTMWYMCTTGYCSVIKKNETIPFVATNSPKVFILSVVSQTEEKEHMTYLIWEI